MDPNNSQPQGGNTNPNLTKLEDDLKKLSQEANQTQAPVATSTEPVQPTSQQPVTNTLPQQPTEPGIPAAVQPNVLPPTPKRKSSLMMVAIILVAIALLALVAYVLGMQFLGQNNNVVIPTPQACTEEAKICPDGSSVGRTGPNCEFAQCPVSETPTTTATPSGTPLMSPTASPTLTPTNSPSPTATPY